MPAAPLLLSTRFRPPTSLGPDRIVRLASEAGCEGLAADESLAQDLLKTVATEALRSGLSVALAVCPLAETALATGKRLPHLAAHEDPEERRAAVKRAAGTLAFGQQLGIPLYVIDFGPVALRSAEARFRLGYARREMGADEPGGRALARAREERKARGQQLYDACRASLEPLLGEAARRGATLAVAMAATPWQVPTPREAHQLLHEFAGAPLAIVYGPARQAVREDLGLTGPPERAGDLARATGLIELTDRVGLETGLTFGLGELTPRVALEVPASAAWLLSGPVDAAFREILRARKSAVELRAQLLAARATQAEAAARAQTNH